MQMPKNTAFWFFALKLNSVHGVSESHRNTNLPNYTN